MEAKEYFEEKKNAYLKKKEVNVGGLNGTIYGEINADCFKNGLEDVEVLNIWHNHLTGNLNAFSALTKLKSLNIGYGHSYSQLNNFSGSLKALEDCKELRYLYIRNQINIKDGLEYLPLDNLKSFDFNNTEFETILKPYDYDIKAWKLINHPDLITEDKDLLKNSIIAKAKKDLAEEKAESLRVDKIPREVVSVGDKSGNKLREEKIIRLESKIELLESKTKVFNKGKVNNFAQIKKEELTKEDLSFFEKDNRELRKTIRELNQQVFILTQKLEQDNLISQIEIRK